jgi:glycosyltransferase involved in cell wall biosynthesis
MRICILSRSTPVHTLGGMEHHCLALSKGLIEKGHEVVLITTAHPDGMDEKTGAFRTIYLEGTVPGRYSRAWWKKSLEVFKELDTQEGFDLILSESTAALSLLKAKARGEVGLPIILRLPGTALRDACSQLRHNPLATLKNIYHAIRDLRWARYADAIITCNDETKRAISRHLRIPKGKIHVVPNGVDTERFTPYLSTQGLRERLRIGEDERVVLCVSRLKREKGIHTLLRAISMISKDRIKVLIIGDGKYKERLKRLSSKLGISGHVNFIGGVSNDEIQHHYALCEVFVMPTMAREGLPWTLLEAMSCQRAVIASRIPGIEEVLEDGVNGLFVKPGDPLELSQRIISLLEEPGLCERLARAARDRIVAQFSHQRMVDETVDLLKRYRKGGSP